MKAYDPRLDTAPGAHVDDERYQVETTNPALLMAFDAIARGYEVRWQEVAAAADLCDRLGPPTVVDVLPGGKDNR